MIHILIRFEKKKISKTKTKTKQNKTTHTHTHAAMQCKNFQLIICQFYTVVE